MKLNSQGFPHRTTRSRKFDRISRLTSLWIYVNEYKWKYQFVETHFLIRSIRKNMEISFSFEFILEFLFDFYFLSFSVPLCYFKYIWRKPNLQWPYLKSQVLGWKKKMENGKKKMPVVWKVNICVISQEPFSVFVYAIQFVQNWSQSTLTFQNHIVVYSIFSA